MIRRPFVSEANAVMATTHAMMQQERGIAAIRARIANLEAEIGDLKDLLHTMQHNLKPVVSLTDDTYLAILTSDPDAPAKTEKKTEAKEEKKEEKKAEAKEVAKTEPSLTFDDPRVCRTLVPPKEEPTPHTDYHVICRS
jgi:chromosome segregation ATPase